MSSALAHRIILLILAGTVGLAGLGAQVGISSITTSYAAGSSSKEKLSGSNVTFDNDTLAVTGLVDTNGNTYTVTGSVASASAILRTDSTSLEKNQSTAWYMGDSAGGTPSTLYGGYNSSNAASLLLGNNLLEGEDDVFVNSSSTSSARTDVERIDFLYNGTAGVVDSGSLAIGVFDRGTGDAFSVAVITGVDSNGNPTSYGGFVDVSNTAFKGGALLNSGDANSTILNSSTNPTEYLVRYDSSTSLATGNVTADSTDTNENITGVVITLASLGIASGTKIYGYSLMGGDVTPGTNLNSLTNYSNPSVFPTNTSDSSAFDGLDPAAVNGVLFSMHVVPEPSTYAEVFLVGAIALYGWRRSTGARRLGDRRG